MLVSRRLRAKAAAVAVVGLTLMLGACTKSSDSSEGNGGQNAAQQVQEQSGSGCIFDKYAGGVEKLDLKSVTVGFAQSEKEANPFRIAETQSIKDEAAKRGIKLITTNAQSDLNKEISDIQSMIAQGAKVLIISPLNSEGLDPALEAAKTAKVPIMTIDRLLTSKSACQDYVGWVGSNFVTQGERAADAMMKVTGDQGKLAILLGAPGVNVTTDREQGQRVTEQMLQSNPDISAIYAHNDEMALGAVAALKAAGKKPGDVKIITIDGTKGAVQGLVDGWISGVIESNPRFGPLAFEALDNFYSGSGVPAVTIISDKEYTK